MPFRAAAALNLELCQNDIIKLPIDKYVRQRQIELAENLKQKNAVYLDVKFWIILRDVATQRRTGNGEIQLLHALRESVSKGKVFAR